MKVVETSADFSLSEGFTPAMLDRVQERSSILMEEAGVPASQRHAAKVVIEELCTNILEHSGATWMELGIRCNGARVTLAIADDGRPFDPTSAQKVLDASAALDGSTSRNLGLYMIRRLAFLVSYIRDEIGINLVHLEINPEFDKGNEGGA